MIVDIITFSWQRWQNESKLLGQAGCQISNVARHVSSAYALFKLSLDDNHNHVIVAKQRLAAFRYTGNCTVFTTTGQAWFEHACVLNTMRLCVRSW